MVKCQFNYYSRQVYGSFTFFITPQGPSQGLSFGLKTSGFPSSRTAITSWHGENSQYRISEQFEGSSGSS